MKKANDDAYSLAEKSDVPQPTTQRFLSGKHGDPRSDTIKKWAAAYGLTESQLRGFTPISDLFDDAIAPLDQHIQAVVKIMEGLTAESRAYLRGRVEGWSESMPKVSAPPKTDAEQRGSAGPNQTTAGETDEDGPGHHRNRLAG